MDSSAGPAIRDDDSPLLSRLAELNQIGVALSQEKDITALLEKILIAAQKITHADGGTLYRRHPTDKNALTFEIIRTDSLGVALGGTTGNIIPFEPLALRDAQGRENLSTVVAYAVLRDCTVNIPDAYRAEGFDFSGTEKFDLRAGYRSQSFLTVPMKNHEGEIIGVLQLINARDPATGHIVAFSATDQRLAESLASQAAVALTNRLLLLQLEQLFESFVKLINDAIDDKSPYTGGHCQRVPELTMLLAEAAHRTARGPLAPWTMTDQERYALRLAGLLHDCGKITTPVHVVDKSTKLSTIHDRIHLVDARFEIARRDAEIACLRARAEPGADAIALEQAYRAQLAALEDDRQFLQTCNTGGEAMSPADQARVRAIAQRYPLQNARGQTTPFLTEDEVENLTIPRGTLTAAEREIINRHVVVTIKMLEALPWPKHLQAVPEYAGAHHERVDGKGYPRGLTRDQMSVPARIMGIADIFEALTARDRPYKPGQKISEALRILGQLRLGGHIDPDLFDVFIRERVYQQYAEQFLDSAQIDPVDVTKIPGYSGD